VGPHARHARGRQDRPSAAGDGSSSGSGAGERRGNPPGRRCQAPADAAADAAREAQAIAEEAAQKAERIAQERYDLETQLLELQGNTIELRSRELAILDPTNRALQEMVWKLSDAKDALTEINEIDFATKVDYLRAVGLSRGGIAGFAAGGMQGALAAVPGTWQSNRAKYLSTIKDAERVNDLPPGLLEKIAQRESGWSSDVISGKRKSSKGATGIMQLMPKFFPNAGQNADVDIWTGAEYLRKLFKQFGSWEDAVAAYNAGPGKLNAVKKGGGGLPTETGEYVNALFGAGAANRVSAPVGTGTVLAPSTSTGNSTQIGTINIYPPVGTPESMRRDLVRSIERKGLVNQSDYGVRP